MKEYFIQPKHGGRIEVSNGQTITVVDADGGQVADFFAEVKGTHEEYLSLFVTIDCDFPVRSNPCIHKKVDGVNDCSLRSKSSIDVIKAIWMIRAVLIKEIIHHLE